MDEFLGFRRRERLKPSRPATFLDALCASKEYLVRVNQSHVVRSIQSATNQSKANHTKLNQKRISLEEQDNPSET
ncbi:hypothetical protein U2G60_000545 [Vibrio fluvialis]|nr:hypothetical protein [Vibrio fluvialis]EMA2445338.1 hypothetical protein [Vibrio fluvialis]